MTGGHGPNDLHGAAAPCDEASPTQFLTRLGVSNSVAHSLLAILVNLSFCCIDCDVICSGKNLIEVWTMHPGVVKQEWIATSSMMRIA